MKRFIQGVAREQLSLFPELLDDYINQDNPVRFIDAFVESLELGELGFKKVIPRVTGRPAYHPSVLLKLYIYGYLNRIQSGRRLEQESQRNVELMWLLERLSPNFKTITDFRKKNGKPIGGVCREFVVLCKGWGLFSRAIAAIDGSKFKAVNNRDKNFTSAKVKLSLKYVENSIERYLRLLDDADCSECAVTEDKTERLQEKIAALKERQQYLRKIETQLMATPDKQISLTDPDARSMKSRGVGIIGYNVQIAVDAGTHLIVAHEVINKGNDRKQLSTMALRAREAMGIKDLTVVADRGYYKSEEILACEEAGITAALPKSLTSGNQAKGLFDRDRFIYLSEINEYRCPAGERLIWRFRNIEHGKTLDCYWSSACKNCPLKSRCTTGKQRRVKRWEHEAVLDKVQTRIDHDPEYMRIRRKTVEHPFGTLKAWMGYTHFLTKTLPKVRTEISLHVLSYNMKRVMNLLGVGASLEALTV